MAFQEPTPWLFNMASFDLHHKEGLDITLSNLALLEEATMKTEEKLRDRMTLVSQRIHSLAEVID